VIESLCEAKRGRVRGRGGGEPVTHTKRGEREHSEMENTLKTGNSEDNEQGTVNTVTTVN
jgi:hypothetical protein